MKKILFVIAASFLSAICGAQQVDFGSIMTNKDGDIHFSEVVQVPNSTANDLYFNAISWVNDTYNSPKTVIQTNDKELGLITIKAITNKGSFSYTKFTMTIQVKDGRYKYDIYDIVIKMSGEYTAGMPDKTYQTLMDEGLDWKASAQKAFGNIVSTLKKQMSSEVEQW